jgi:hypothetical protein
MKLTSDTADDWSCVASRIAMASIGSQGTIGGLMVAGFVSYIWRNDFFF